MSTIHLSSKITLFRFNTQNKNNTDLIIIIIIIIGGGGSSSIVATLLLLLLLLLTAIGLSPSGSGYFTCIQNMKLVTDKFKSGGLHEKHVVASWSLGNHLSICS